MFVASQYGLEHFVLPDFGSQPTQGLQIFLESFFRLNLPDRYYIQLYVVSGLIAIIELFGLLIIIKQLWARTLWLFRIQETSSSVNLIVPNSTASFIIFEGLFGFVYLGYAFYTRAVDLGQTSPDGRAFFTLYVWVALFVGAHIASVGTLYTSPGLLSRSCRSSQRNLFNIRTLIPSPLVCNLWFLGYPASIACIMLVLGALAGKDYREAAQNWHALDSQLSAQAPNSPLTPEQITAAMKIWQTYASSYWWITIGFLTFSVAAGTLLAFYSGASIFLISTLREQIEKSGGLFAGGFRTLTKSEAPAETPNWSDGQVENQAGNREAAEEETRAAQSQFFPPIRGAKPRHTEAKTQQQRVQVLRSALQTITTMAICINLGIIGYCANTAFIAWTTYEAASTSPQAIAHNWYIFNVVAMWLAGVFGTATFFAILTNTYSEFLSSRPTLSLSTVSARRSSRSKGSRASGDAFQLGRKRASVVTNPRSPVLEVAGEGYQQNNSSLGEFIEKKGSNTSGDGDEEARLSDDKTATDHHHSSPQKLGMLRSAEPVLEDQEGEEGHQLPGPTRGRMEHLDEAAQAESMIDAFVPSTQIRPASAASSFEASNIRWDQSKWTKPQVWLPSSGRRSNSRDALDTA